MPLYPKQLASEFDHTVLRGQFALSRNVAILPPDWEHRVHAGWTLATHPALPVVDITDSAGQVTGWLLGYAISPDARLGGDAVQLPAVTGHDLVARFEDFLYNQLSEAVVCFYGDWLGDNRSDE